MHQRHHPTLALALVAALMLSGCQTTGGQKEGIGTALGAVGGALIGSQIGKGSGRVAAVIVGGVVGAGIGNRIGRYLDEQDRALQAEATANALSTEGNNSQRWINPDGNSGTVNATPAGPADDTRYVECRSVERTLDAREGLSDTLRFCRQPDGRWIEIA
jgi:surface antigen